MPLPLIADSLDAIPEAVRGEYARTEDGKFRLSIDGYEDPAAMKGALQKERAARAAAEKAAKTWADMGYTPEQIAEMADSARKAEETRAEKAGEWDKLRAQLNDRHAADLKKAAADTDAARQVADGFRARLERQLIDSSAISAIAAAQGVPDLLLPHVRQAVRAVEEGGEYVVRVVDARGDPRVNGKGDPLSVAELVAEMREHPVFARAFGPSGATGGGASGAGAKGGKTMTRTQFEALPPAERHASLRDGFSVTD